MVTGDSAASSGITIYVSPPLTGPSSSIALSTAGQTTPAPTLPNRPNKISTSHLPQAVSYFVGRDAELDQLDAAWEDPKTRVISLVAFGGVGKSALVAEWLRRLADQGWRGAQHVLGHSFYSQGSRDEAQVSAEGFINEALRFFGDPSPEAGSALDKGERLARLIRRTRTLLILDGMEPLQWGAASVEVGRIKDQGLAALVRELAADNPGLCVITTRQAVADISAAAKIDLEALSDQAGAALLGALGVQGLQLELEAASRQVQGHGLALRLLGTYLQKVCRGDVRRIGEVDLARVDQELGGHAYKLVEKYERWLVPKQSTLQQGKRWVRKKLGLQNDYSRGEIMLSILRLLGLFDRPAEVDCLAAVCAAPVIPGLTEALVNLSVEDCQWAVSNLIDYGLLSADSLADVGNRRAINSQFSIPNSLDAHPLIREYFAAQLAGQYPDATKEAHRRLYEHLKQVAPELPDTLQKMMPLYHAVGHGGKAELWQEALDDVFYNRIQRKEEKFSERKLGAMGTDLAALIALFDVPFTRPNPNLTEDDQAWVLNQVSFCLRALGRLAEAIQPMQAAVERYITAQDWKNAAIQASNLSELYLTLGDVAAAVRVGEQAVELSDRSGDSFQRMINRTNLANALHQTARLPSSLMAFRETEALQAEQNTQYSRLYSLAGFYYCDLLLERDLLEPGEMVEIGPSDRSGRQAWLTRCDEVRDRAEKTLEIAQTSELSLLTHGLDNLTLGRTYLLEATFRHKHPAESITAEALTALLQQATHHLHQSVSLLRQAGQEQELPRGLLARAALWRMNSKFKILCEKSKALQNSKLVKDEYLEKANRDLAEVEQIADRSKMLIFQIEATLERCRLALAMDNQAQARTKLDEAKALVKQTERPYVPHVPTWDEWQPPESVGVFQAGEMVGYHRCNGGIAELEQQLGA
ncbi:MAG: AAA family ATPase [Cyanobacteria bacterium P01_H01_bin.119]